jgi:hypothetical protein
MPKGKMKRQEKKGEKKGRKRGEKSRELRREGMNHKTEDRPTREDEDSLFRYLTPDTPEAKKIKSLQGKEYEYAEYIGMVEYSIASYYYEADRKMTDKGAASALKNIRKNCSRPVSYFNRDLEKEIIESLIEVLKEKPVTIHELKLVIDYVLEVISNRSWMGDKQAYIKWVAYIMDLFTEKEKEEYEKEIKNLAAEIGLSGKHADLMLMKGEEKDYFEFIEEYGEEYENTEGYRKENAGEKKDQKIKREKPAEERLEEMELTDEELVAEMENNFILMEDAEKFDFLLENGPEFYEFTGLYISELAEKKDFDRIQELYSKLTEKYDNFLYLYVIMGATYLEIDPVLAKFYFEQALKTLDKLDEFSDSTKEKLRTSFLSFIEKIS